MNESHYDHLLDNGDVHTLHVGCPDCTRFAADPRLLGRRESMNIIGKFYPNDGVASTLPERTNLDAQFVSNIERAYGIARGLGWIPPSTVIAAAYELYP